jgi:hypothetical protein
MGGTWFPPFKDVSPGPPSRALAYVTSRTVGIFLPLVALLPEAPLELPLERLEE